ncbi:hypothetical protein [Filimonas effusa]|uniref:Uncharacterized protein n=1 Tax=Filimonas effusa TaxID=2508721 RepID=A0A4Q1DCK8_9BACT|nr:hypothetical protein [Filimonas effusa]RXK86698.1 hypothetical protein ESB13_07795 [Filimonas effusa]
MINTHLKVRRLIRGRFSENIAILLQKKINQWSFDDFACYLPGLFRYLKKERRALFRKNGYELLALILPPFLEERYITKLLDCIETEELPGSRALLIKSIHKRRLPEQLSIATIRRMMRIDDGCYHRHGIAAAGRAGNEGISLLLDALKCTRNDIEVRQICQVLFISGNLRCLPVLMARLGSLNDKCDKSIYNTMRAIETRFGVPNDLQKLINDPDTWKMRWGTSPQHFVSFMNMLSVLNGFNIESDFVDWYAGLFIAELEIDIGSYESYTALRLSCNKKEWMAELLEEMSHQADGRLTIDKLLQAAGVTYSEASRTAKLSKDMIIECFFIKLNLRIPFS